jgi:tricorn protease
MNNKFTQLKTVLISALIILTTSTTALSATLLLRQPSIGENTIAFVYAGDVWVADDNGDNPRRLTIHQGMESNPHLSPDGRWVAFTGVYDGNTDVYVVATTGGLPVRLTYHGAADEVRGWMPQGDRVIFRSRRNVSTPIGQLLTVGVGGDYPQLVKLPRADRASWSPDGKSIAYTPWREVFQSWKRYRGGTTSRIWITDLDSYETTKIPRENSNDTRPVWLGDRIYFLSDRNHTMNVFSYAPTSGEVAQLTHHDDYDVKELSGHGERLVYSQGGRLHRLDIATGRAEPIDISIAPDQLGVRPHFEKVKGRIEFMNVSPSGKRAVFAARGDIYTVPKEKGNCRNLTRTTGTCDRYPAWSPDGNYIAYFSDASGEYQLMIQSSREFEKAEIIDLEPTFYYNPIWSPNSKLIAFTDKRLNLYFYDRDAKSLTKVDTDTYDHPHHTLDPIWAPDNGWLAYSKRLANHMHAIFVYNLKSGQTHQITDGMSDAISPVFSRDGKYLYFTASTDYAQSTGWLDMSSYDHRITRSLYLVVLDEDSETPFGPESDEEEPSADDDAEESDNNDDKDNEDKSDKSEVTVKIDFDGLDQRILALPTPAKNYSNLQVANGDKLFYMETAPGKRTSSLKYFDMSKRESKSSLSGIRNYIVSGDGKEILYSAPDTVYGIVAADGEHKVGDGELNLAGLETMVDPRAEWRQIYDEVWRIERDFFYVENMHGCDWEAVHARYLPWVEHVQHRDDLNFVMREMISELVIGHNFLYGGDYPDVDRVGVGLLGADYELVDGYYRIKRIYQGLNWNPDLTAPLTQPGINVAEGDYILAVDGIPLRAPTNIYQRFENKAGKQVEISVGKTTSLDDARTVVVVPIAREFALRNRAWVEGNQEKVSEATDGRVAYVYLPNTSSSGFTYFNRYYFSQIDKEAVIIDERFNGGGSVADYFIDMLDRPLLNYWGTREGSSWESPVASIFGPKVMIINESAGSGGDWLPHMFRKRNLGKLVGTTTWGGLVGIYSYPPLIDGGRMAAPRMGFYTPEGEWAVENVGVPPDIEVEMTPKLVNAGRDPQLEKAIETILEELSKNPQKKTPKPPDPVRVR